MTVLSMISTILIGPIKLIFETIFEYAYRFAGHPGLAIVFLSLAMNILVLPLYRRADAMQEETRDREAKLQNGVAHIKKTFSGDERMMILQTYYRQNHYKPTDALNGSVSLLLEIPFFIAAYQFLSHLEILSGVSFGPIKDLGAPDGLLMLGGLAVNLLPILMTLINVISSSLYLRGFPLKSKIQLYAMALFFLVFLYSSPSCLVFYWTLNNLFSLVKNIFYKLKNPQKILRCLCAVAGLALFVFAAFFFHTDSFKRKAILCVVGLLLLLPLLLPLLKKAVSFQEKAKTVQPDSKLFLLGTVFIAILTGLLIPSALIAASPQEYVDITNFLHPLWYIVSALCYAVGTFLIWMRVFYWLADAKGKTVFAWLVWVLCGVFLVDYMLFGTDMGILNSALFYEFGMYFSWREQLINLLVLAAVAAVMLFCANKWKRFAASVLTISIIAFGVMSALNLVTIKKSVDDIVLTEITQHGSPSFQLSKKGRNVVVLMLDRAMGEYIPYMFNEKPELKEQFSGFTYYENTISFGGFTNFGTPALFGGYEYTPVEMNKRNTEPLVTKHNEALLMMPVIFSENGYQVTVCDPVYANYQSIPDLSIYDAYPGIRTYLTSGWFGNEELKQANIENSYRNFFCFGVMKSMPLFLQPTIYNNGRYHHILHTFGQTRESISVATGVDAGFMDAYNVLANLPDMTEIAEDSTDTFLVLTNNATHEPMLLQEPSYLPADKVDNTEYDAAHADRFIVNGRELKVKSESHMIHYHANMAAMVQLGEWFDYLRENDLYNNTRIILASDHGRPLGQLEELIAGKSFKDLEYYYPLLMVKDFDSEGFTTSDTFMTHADVPTLAMEELIQAPVNPFTGKAVNNDEKYAHDQYIIMSSDWGITENSGNTFLPAQWASVKENLWDLNNWTFFDDLMVLDQHAAP